MLWWIVGKTVICIANKLVIESSYDMQMHFRIQKFFGHTAVLKLCIAGLATPKALSYCVLRVHNSQCRLRQERFLSKRRSRSCYFSRCKKCFEQHKQKGSVLQHQNSVALCMDLCFYLLQYSSMILCGRRDGLLSQ